MATQVTQPHGWAPTTSGKMLHYWGLPYRQQGYRSDGSAVALCHNALRAAPGHELLTEVPAEAAKCASCERYLAQAPWALKNPAPPKADPTALKGGCLALVTRGTHKDRTVTLRSRAQGYPGFWMCALPKQKRRDGVLVDTDEATEVMLSEGQLAVAEAN